MWFQVTRPLVDLLKWYVIPNLPSIYHCIGNSFTKNENIRIQLLQKQESSPAWPQEVYLLWHVLFGGGKEVPLSWYWGWGGRCWHAVPWPPPSPPGKGSGTRDWGTPTPKRTWYERLGYPLPLPGTKDWGTPSPAPMVWQANWKYNLSSYAGGKMWKLYSNTDQQHCVGRSRAARDAPPVWIQFLSFSCSFMGKLKVSTPTYVASTPSSRKSWVRHWTRTK